MVFLIGINYAQENANIFEDGCALVSRKIDVEQQKTDIDGKPNQKPASVGFWQIFDIPDKLKHIKIL